MKAIADRATEALRAIGRQSEINARRIRIYGVTLERPAKDGALQEAGVASEA
jgi:hypothetical protein